ncbi:MAG: ethylbenzene dehydrogenase-related protein [Candidatus Paceibacterota bacterium]
MKRDENSNRLLLGIFGGAALIVVTMITAIFLVSRRPVVVVVPRGDDASSHVIPAPAAASGLNANDGPTEAPTPEITITKLASAPSVDDPLDPAWEKIAVVEVDLAPQQVAPPVLEKATVPKIRVQAVRDDQRYVWRLSWDKAGAADRSEVSQFTDAVAMQFPLVDGAPYTMGGPDMPVRMLYWKAVWQKDVDEGFQGLAKVHPNTDVDLYWFADGKEQHAADGSIDNDTAMQWMVAAKSGNPMADYERKHPIEELTAHGFGSGTHIDGTPSRGRGEWNDGQWFVVFDRPIEPSDPLIERFNASPDRQMIAFAVWDGDNANRGGKKQITNWLPMRIIP